MPTRWLRSPAVLVTAYVGLYVYAGPFVTIGSTHAYRSAFEIIIAVALAVFAVRGSRVSTHWLFVAASQGIHAVAFAADLAMWSMSALLALYLVSLSRRRDFPLSGEWSVASPPAPAAS